MTVKKEGAVIGRPRVSPRSRPMKITISEDDYTLLKSISDLAGGTPSGLVRELILESRPHLLGTLSALESARKGDKKEAISMLARVGASSILELLEEPSVQQELLNEGVTFKSRIGSDK